ncbi:MAG: trigger factor family protein, partial [Acutalibacter sp.]|nr:trigger factor family protein [Acutalibacter sp.]
MNLKSCNNVETNKYELVLEVAPEEFAQAINEVYKRESKRMNVPGFRKGKAPRAFIEKFYGEEVFFQAAVDHLYTPMIWLLYPAPSPRD